ncbi:hypothetical protein KUTeg_022146 [Tegillarca granosa]|uniref:Uncharacterized protein n=1 Tax=Tegillarca granosa TaxID=220873 RepID=A0ABQ9EAP5_TEGGR|nr:hypothetical protein KUTeg_022146 [Tegillarca granosa]
MAQDMNIITYLMVLKELLGPLNNLSLFLQRDDTTLADAYLMLESTKDNIQTNSTQLKDLCETGMYQGRKLKGQSPKLAYRAEFVKAIVGSLENRFSTDHELLKSTQIASFRIWPPAKEKASFSLMFQMRPQIPTRLSTFQNKNFLAFQILVMTKYGDNVNDLSLTEIEEEDYPLKL